MTDAEHHPSFEHPGITEALCEVHYGLGEKGWKPTAFGDFFSALQPDYPEFEPVAEMGFQFQLGPVGVSQELVPAQQRVRYKHSERQVLIHLSNSVFALNVLPVYSGWGQMQTDLLDAWQRLVGVLPVASISRVGLRYINRFPKEEGEPVGAWLKSSDFIPAAALPSLRGLLSRLEVHPNQTDTRIVTVADVNASGAGDPGLVFDIDCISEGSLDPSAESIAAQTERLHEEAWRIFEASVTPRLTEYLKSGRA